MVEADTGGVIKDHSVEVPRTLFTKQQIDALRADDGFCEFPAGTRGTVEVTVEDMQASRRSAGEKHYKTISLGDVDLPEPIEGVNMGKYTITPDHNEPNQEGFMLADNILVGDARRKVIDGRGRKAPQTVLMTLFGEKTDTVLHASGLQAPQVLNVTFVVDVAKDSMPPPPAPRQTRPTQ